MNRSSEYLKWKKPNVDSIYGILPVEFRKKGLLIHIYLLVLYWKHWKDTHDTTKGVACGSKVGDSKVDRDGVGVRLLSV